jgi:hypothetical protein
MQLLTHASETEFPILETLLIGKFQSQGRAQYSLAMRDAKLLQNIDT